MDSLERQDTAFDPSKMPIGDFAKEFGLPTSRGEFAQYQQLIAIKAFILEGPDLPGFEERLEKVTAQIADLEASDPRLPDVLKFWRKNMSSPKL